MHGFRGEDFWLSNSYPAAVMFDGRVYPTNWHAWAAACSYTEGERLAAQQAPSAAVAAALARRYTTTTYPKAEALVEKMKRIVPLKFQLHSELGRRLVATGSTPLLAEEPAGDSFWGLHNGRGHNYLGRILMDVRSDLREACKAR